MPGSTGTSGSTASSYGASGSSAAGAAPPAPGRLGGTVTPQEAFAYLRDLDVWKGRRRDELDGLDAAALASSERDTFSRDLLVSMALWKAVSDRYDLLEIAFDNGRVGPTQAQRIAALVWGGSTSRPTRLRRRSRRRPRGPSPCRCPRPAGCSTR